MEVVYLEQHESGRVHKQRARLSELLNKMGAPAVGAHWCHADPSKLLLEAARALDGMLLMLSQMAGYMRPPGRKTFNMTQINIYELMPNVMEVLDRHPQAKDEVIRAVQEALVQNH